MNTLKLTCIEVSQRDGYSIVTLQASSNDSTIYASGNVGFTVTDASNFTVGKDYDLNLTEVGLDAAQMSLPIPPVEPDVVEVPIEEPTIVEPEVPVET